MDLYDHLEQPEGQHSVARRYHPHAQLHAAQRLSRIARFIVRDGASISAPDVGMCYRYLAVRTRGQGAAITIWARDEGAWIGNVELAPMDIQQSTMLWSPATAAFLCICAAGGQVITFSCTMFSRQGLLLQM